MRVVESEKQYFYSLYLMDRHVRTENRNIGPIFD